MAMDARLRATVLTLLLVVGFLARGSTFASPLLDLHSWRQGDTASISRNFVRDGLNPLQPRVDHIGPGGSSRALTGLELHAWLVALASALRGTFEPEVGRLLSSIYFAVSALLLWSLAVRRYGEGAALAGTIVYAFGFPLLFFFERAFTNEALLVLLSLASLHQAQRYVEGRRRLALAGTGVSLVLIAVIKPTYLIVLAPVAGMFVERRGWRGLLAWELLAGSVVSVAAVGLWFSQAHAAVGPSGVSFGLVDKLTDWSIVTSSRYWFVIGRRLLKDVLGPLGLVAYVVGIVAATRNGRRMEVFGCAGVLVYLIVVAVGNAVHNYYQLAVMPAAAPTIALGVWTLVAGRVRPDDAVARTWARLALVATIAISTSLMRFSGSHSWFAVDWTKEHACHELPKVVAPGETLVFAGYNSPDILFCSDRRGWLLAPHESTAEAIAAARQRGAAVLVVAREQPVPLPPHSGIVFQNPRFLALRLR
jgi:hypothetical protein